MVLPLTIFSFFLGLVMGSFLNVVIRRGAREENFGGRSHCESCRAILSPLELIPILSFLRQKGRCRHCGVPFSLQYPLVELGTGLAFSSAVWLFPPEVSWFGLLTLTAVFFGISAAIVIFVSDIQYKIIPNGAVLTLFLAGILRFWLSQTSVPDLVWDMGAALGAALLLALLWFISKGRWMGFGDVKLIFVTSLILGFPVSLVVFLFSFWLGGIFGIIWIVAGRGNMKSQIPFGPFILLGSVLAYFGSSYFFTLLPMVAIF